MRAGWPVIAARRTDAIEQRFTASGASIVLVDARGALDEGLAAIGQLADAAEVNRCALIALLSRRDVSALDRVLAAGATHYLASPFGEVELAQALRFAGRHAQRLQAQRRRPGGGVEDQRAEWRWIGGNGPLGISRAARSALALEEDRPVTPRMLLASLERADRHLALRAVARLRGGAGASAFAHAAPGGGRIAHHLRLDADQAVVGRIELIAGAAQAGEADPLTGLLALRPAREMIAAALAQGPVSLILAGLSRFDAINAAFGRVTGDRLLRAAATRIGRTVAGAAPAGGGLAARVAGARFLLVLPGLDDEATQQLGRAIVEAFAAPLVVQDQLVPVSIHLGIVGSEPGERDAEALLRRASATLADARIAGDRMLSAGEEGGRRRAALLEVDLRRALAEDRIEILFQPQIAVPTGEVAGVEALARWRHPGLGEIDAATLFEVAARSDYSLQLSAHIHGRVFAEVAAWPASLGRLRVAINVTAADLARTRLPDDLLVLAEASGVPPGRVTLELTEESLVADLAAAAAALARLRQAGFRTALDDFGTGYSALSYLKALPLDYLKIDRSLTADIAGARRDRIVVNSAIELARSLDLQVIAEGVETPEQLALLAEAGCTLYQGFLFAGPLTSAALAERLG